VCLCITPYFLGKFPQQRRIVGSVVFYAIHVISKENRRLVLLRTPCSLFWYVELVPKVSPRLSVTLVMCYLVETLTALFSLAGNPLMSVTHQRVLLNKKSNVFS
jgi:hypothetical protein